ncbi:hypothetical protein NJNGDCLN_03076 [Mannheimia haemolytica]
MKPSNRAFYQPGEDKVVMPEMKQFANAQAFHSVLLHEMTHATGQIIGLIGKVLLPERLNLEQSLCF